MVKAERLGELVRHQVIDTPLESVLGTVRRARHWLSVLEHPELEQVFLSEPTAIEKLVEQTVAEGMCCVDVGAHIGSVTAVLRRLSPTGKHIAVEPTPYKAAWLRAKFSDVEIHECALSDKAGRATFYLKPESAFSGLRNGAHGQDAMEIDVAVRTLDEIVPADRVIQFLKVDVEGAELNVFRGGDRVLTRDRPTILFECTLDGLVAYKQDPGEVFAFFSERGYRLYTPVDRIHDRAPLDEAAFDRAVRYPFRAFNFFAIPQ